MRHTPWGKADYSKKIVRGIRIYCTPSHGGIFVSFNAAKKYLSKYLVNSMWFKERYSGGGYWFEEDCDANLIIYELYQSCPVEILTCLDIESVDLLENCKNSITRFNRWYKNFDFA